MNRELFGCARTLTSMMSPIPGRKPQRLVISSDSISSLEDRPRAQASEDRPRPDNQIGNKQASERSRSKKAILNKRRKVVLLACAGMLLGSGAVAYSEASQADDYAFTPPGMPRDISDQIPPYLRVFSHATNEKSESNTPRLAGEKVDGYSSEFYLDGGCANQVYTIVFDRELIDKHLSGAEALDGYVKVEIPDYLAFSYSDYSETGYEKYYRTDIYPEDRSYLIEVECTHWTSEKSDRIAGYWRHRLYSLLSGEEDFW